MTTPDSYTTPAGASGAPQAGPKSSRTWPVLTAAFAVTSLVLAGLLLWPSGEAEAEEPVLGSAQTTVELTCQILEEVPTSDLDVQDPEYYVAQGQALVVASLGWLASAHDPEYATFRTVTQEPRSLTDSAHRLDSPEFVAAVDAAKSECADRLSKFED